MRQRYKPTSVSYVVLYFVREHSNTEKAGPDFTWDSRVDCGGGVAEKL